MEQPGFLLPFDLHQELTKYLGKRPLRRVAGMYTALQNLPRSHIPIPQSVPAPAPALVVKGDTEDGVG